MTARSPWVMIMLACGMTVAPPAFAAKRGPLPPGPERVLVRKYCNVCHSLTRIAKAHGNQAGWEDRLHRMIRFGATLPKEDIPRVAAYLAKAFPPRPIPVDTDVPEAAPDAAAPVPNEGGTP